ncbi:chromosome partitioning protein ParA [Bacteroidia bacterium]|nr:chromosome partitioning protein ParA [Bacteroidia bacterium]GHV07459.1 chromosome partitioning protein ParA [Bacteroidia bacterium]
MSNKRTAKTQPEEELINILDLWQLVISNWYWFAASLFVALSMAAIYIAITPPVYTRTASLLIKDNKSNSGILDNTAVFNDLGLFKSNTNLSNEILMLQSPLLVEEVVKRLKLNQNYTLKGKVRDTDLYNQTPIIILFNNVDDEQSFSFLIELLPNNKFRLSEFTIDNVKAETVLNGDLAEPMLTPFGEIKIIPTLFYSTDSYHSEILFTKANLKRVTDAYVSALKVAFTNDEATIIDLTINDVSTQRAEDMLNTLITVYNENWIKDKNQIAVSTSGFIDDRLIVIEGELGGVDENISQYKSKNLLPDVQAVSNLYLRQSSENSAQILALTTQRTIVQAVRNSLRDPNAKDQLLPANMGLENTGVENQIKEYNTMLLKKNQYLANSSESNPLVIDLNQSLESVRQSVVEAVDNLLSKLETQINDISRSEQKTSQRIASNPEQAKFLLSVERQQKIKEALYLFLLQKREENELSQAFTAYNTKIIVPPSGELFPTAPRKSIILVMALAIGFFLPFAVLFLKENMNATVRGRKDLDILTAPYIGEIPLMREKKNKPDRQTNIVVQEGSRDYMNEAFRVIRTKIDFMKGMSDQVKVMMFTSFNVGSGKTFTATNLAISMALRGKEVVVIDLDMRKASLSKSVNSPKTGISNYLGYMIDNPQEIIVKGVLHPNLDIIPVGTIPPNPAELLLDKRLGDLIAQLRQQYDYILLDCPPVEIVADANIIETVSDLTVFVIRAGLMDRRVLPEVDKFYEEKTFKNMAVLLNGTTFKTGKYGYHKYGYHYGYGHEYGA